MKINRRSQQVLVTGGFLEVFKVALPLILSSSCHAANMFFDRLMLARYAQDAVASAFTGGLTALAEYKLSGDTAVVVGTDAGAAAKVIDTFSKDTKGVLAAKCGYIEGVMLSDKDVAAIAGLPSKDALRAQLLGLLVAVPTGLVRVLNAKASSIVNVINAYKNKLEQN